MPEVVGKEPEAEERIDSEENSASKNPETTEEGGTLEGAGELDDRLADEVGDMEEELESGIEEVEINDLEEDESETLFEKAKSGIKSLRKKMSEFKKGVRSIFGKNEKKINAVQEEIDKIAEKIAETEAKINALTEAIEGFSSLKIPDVDDKYQSLALLNLIKKSKKQIEESRKAQDKATKNLETQNKKIEELKANSLKQIEKEIDNEYGNISKLEDRKEGYMENIEKYDTQIADLKLPDFDHEKQEDRDRESAILNPMTGNKEAYEKAIEKKQKLELKKQKLEQKIEKVDEEIQAKTEHIDSLKEEASLIQGNSEAEEIAEDTTPEAEEIAEDSTPETEEIAEDTTPEAEEIAEDSTPETEEIAEDSTPEAEEIAEDSTPEATVGSVESNESERKKIGKALEKEMHSIEVVPGKGLEALKQFENVSNSYEKLPTSVGENTQNTRQDAINLIRYATIEHKLGPDGFVIKNGLSVFSNEYGKMREKLQEIVDQIAEDNNEKPEATSEKPENVATEKPEATSEEPENVTPEEPEVAAEEPEATTEEPENIATDEPEKSDNEKWGEAMDANNSKLDDIEEEAYMKDNTEKPQEKSDNEKWGEAMDANNSKLDDIEEEAYMKDNTEQISEEEKNKRRLEVLNGINTTLEKKLENVTSSIDSAKERISKVSQDIEQKQMMIDGIKEASNDMSDPVKAGMAQIMLANGDLEKYFEEPMNSMIEERDSLQNELSELEAQKTEIEEEIAKTDEAIEKIQSKNEESNEEKSDEEESDKEEKEEEKSNEEESDEEEEKSDEEEEKPGEEEEEKSDEEGKDEEKSEEEVKEEKEEKEEEEEVKEEEEEVKEEEEEEKSDKEKKETEEDKEALSEDLEELRKAFIERAEKATYFDGGNTPEWNIAALISNSKNPESSITRSVATTASTDVNIGRLANTMKDDVENGSHTNKSVKSHVLEALRGASGIELAQKLQSMASNSSEK